MRSRPTQILMIFGILLFLLASITSAVSVGEEEHHLTTTGSDVQMETRSDATPNIYFSQPEEVYFQEEIDFLGFVHHPNGYRYRIGSETTTEQVGASYVSVTGLIIEMDDGSGYWSNLGTIYKLGYGAHTFAFVDIDSEGNMNGLTWWRNKASDAFLCMPLSVRIGEDPESITYIKGDIRTIPEEPLYGWGTSIDELPIVAYYAGEELHINAFETGADLEMSRNISPALIPTYDVLGTGDGLFVVGQEKGGNITLSRYNRTLDLLVRAPLIGLPDGAGADNGLFLLDSPECLELFLYRDELLTGRYADLQYYRLDNSGTILSHKSIVFPHEEGASSGVGPMKVLGANYFLSYNGTTMMEFDLDLEHIRNHRISDYGITSIDAIRYYTVGEEAFFYFSQAYRLYNSNEIHHVYSGFCSHRPDAMPELGYYYLPDGAVLEGVTLTLTGDLNIEEGRTVTIKDSTIFVGDEDVDAYDVDISNDGTLTLINTTIISINNYCEFNNYGDGHLTLIDSYLDINGEIDGTLEVYGRDMFHNHMGKTLSIDYCTVYINGLTIDQSEIENTMDRTMPLFYNDGEAIFTFNDCHFSSIRYLIEGDEVSVRFRNSSLIEVDRTLKAAGYYGSSLHTYEMENCSVIRSGGFSFNLNQLINCTFVDCDLQSFMHFQSFSLVDCRFQNITGFDFSNGNSLSVLRCEFTGFEYAIDADYCSNIRVVDTTIRNSEWGIYSNENDQVVINGCTFESLNVSICLESDYDIYLISHINNNTFLNDNISIYYTGHNEFDFEDYYSYESGDDNIRDEIEDYHGVDFLDCRYNVWENGDPDVVAGKISPGIYFLPYYTTDGTLVTTSDNDIDGMDDGWEDKNGLDSSYYFDRYLDPDRDFYSNYEEFRSDTDPNDKEDNPAKGAWTSAVLLGVFFGIIPISLMISFLFYFQFAKRRERIRRFERIYADHHRATREREINVAEVDLATTFKRVDGEINDETLKEPLEGPEGVEKDDPDKDEDTDPQPTPPEPAKDEKRIPVEEKGAEKDLTSTSAEEEVLK